MFIPLFKFSSGMAKTGRCMHWTDSLPWNNVGFLLTGSRCAETLPMHFAETLEAL